jgi:predicted ATPase/class 3 adenylate cyclase
MKQAEGPLPEGVVTFLLTDIEDSTRLWDDDTDVMSAALETHERVIAEVVATHDGRLLRERGEGDSTLSVFARASDAVAAALDVQRALRGPTWPHELILSTRMALHTGEPHMRDGEYYGGTLNRAARIRGLANGGEILCSRTTHDLVVDSLPDDAEIEFLGEHELRGLQRREAVFAVIHPDIGVERRPRLDASADPRARFGAPADAFVGRNAELKLLEQELERPGLVTLTGAGGIGKTRLALEGATKFAPRFEHARLVRLAGLPDDADIGATLEAAITPSSGVAPVGASQAGNAIDRVVEVVAGARWLVVIDNCEHVRASAADALQAITSRCPDLTVLATSRQRLSVPGERVVSVPTLEVPTQGKDDVRQFGAVELLIERASAIDFESSTSDAEIEALGEICRAVDGMPLGLELAAARLDTTSAVDLAERMTRQLELLRGEAPREERHRTLDATIEWSYRLLGTEAQTLLRRLAVFAGGFTLDAAERVCLTPDDGALRDAGSVHLALDELVSSSMVVFERERQRYRLLVPIRLFALRKLDGDSNANDVFYRHAEWVLDIGRVLSREHVYGSPEALPRLGIEADNIDAALNWCEVADHELQLEIVARVGFLWFSSDWRRGLRNARRATRDRRGASSRHWADALMSRGMLEQRGKLEASIPPLRECLDLECELGNRHGEAWARFWLGKGLFVADRAECRALLSAAIDDFRGLNNALGLTWAIVNLSATFLSDERHAEARALLEEAATLARERGLNAALGGAIADLGTLRLRDGDIDGAREMLDEARELQLSAGDRYNLLGTTTQLALLELVAGHLGEADRLLCDALAAGLEQHDAWELCETLVGVAKLCLLRGDQHRAWSYVAATGWDVASPWDIGMSSTSATAKALRDVTGTAPVTAGVAEGRRLGIEGAARRYLGDDDASSF